MASEEESNDSKWVVFQYFTKFDFPYWNQVKPLTFVVKYLILLCFAKGFEYICWLVQYSVGLQSRKT